MKILNAVLATSFVALGGCTEAKKAPAAKAPAPVQAVAPSSQPAHAAKAPGAAGAPAGAASQPAIPDVVGKVVQTMNSGGYTYVELDTGAKEKIWAAGPNASVKVGDTVGFTGGSAMQAFTSKTLKRTFDTIYFVGALQVANGPSGAASVPAGKAVERSPKVEVGKVAKAEGGLTVAEIFAQSAGLSGKQVVLRGKVVKFNGGIMGKNWLHIQDGTGEANKNDLTVTTDATAEVGDLVVIKGMLTLDKDFGAGYKYAVIVENATVTK